jgi:hypothetical protein
LNISKNTSKVIDLTKSEVVETTAVEEPVKVDYKELYSMIE